MLRSFSLHRSLPRLLLASTLLVLPLISIWNMSVEPGHDIKLGPKLAGVTDVARISFSWSAITGGGFQKAAALRITEALALRPLLIRLNNSIRFELFGDFNESYVVRGAKGHLIGSSYLIEYCARTGGMGQRLAAEVAPGLKEIQDHYRAAGGEFVYLISPSKAAHLPEYFLDRFVCTNSPAARAHFIPDYVGALRAAGISVVDGASLIHAQKGSYEVPLFPEGGEHWNDIGGALAVSAVVDEINRQAGRVLIPPFSFTYSLSNAKSKADRELADLLNVFFPPLGYVTAKVSFDQPASCRTHPAHDLAIAMVGSSFGFLPSQIMLEHNCLSRLNFYYYAKLGLFGGEPFHELQRNLERNEVARAADAQVMILEENESFVGRTNYTRMLYDVVSK